MANALSVRVVISEFMDAAAVRSLESRFATVYDPGLVDDRSALEEQVAGADALIVRNKTRVDGALIAMARQLKIVGRLGVGLDNIDLAACKARAIRVIPATGANALAVAEYVICTTMLLLRGAYRSTPAVADGKWPRSALSHGREAAGKTLGVVGFGSTGQSSGRLARAIGMHVIGFDAKLEPDDPVWTAERSRSRKFDDVLCDADVVTLHVPLTAATRGLIDAGKLSLMKPDAILINMSRGGIVDEAALATALRSGKLGGAAIDVFDTEPLPAGSPLAGCPHLVLTPHIAGVTRESNVRVSSLIAEKVAAALLARP